MTGISAHPHHYPNGHFLDFSNGHFLDFSNGHFLEYSQFHFLGDHEDNQNNSLTDRLWSEGKKSGSVDDVMLGDVS